MMFIVFASLGALWRILDGSGWWLPGGMQVVVAEANSDSWLARNWRPITMRCSLSASSARGGSASPQSGLPKHSCSPYSTSCGRTG